jgi:hypothetical protein
LTEQRASSAATDLSLLDRKFTWLVLDLRIAQTRAAIDWLGSADPGPN